MEVAPPPLAHRGRAVALGLLAAAVSAYALLFALRTSQVFWSGGSLFDLAVYEQGFWNALGSPPFFYSLEGEMSRFGRHFSPVFYLLLPAYWLYPAPPTLLALHSLAIGLGALPVYALAAPRLGRPMALVFAAAYLLNPAVHDVNQKNDFHEIGFTLPALLLVIWLGLDGRTWHYWLAVALALSTREEAGVSVALFGAYLLVVGRRGRGLATIAAGLVYFLVVVGFVMPRFNTTGRFPLPEGYEYLGGSLGGIVRGALTRPDLVLRTATESAKLSYLFWLLAPLAFLPLLAPELLAVGGFALAQVLASTYQYHYEIFERYAAPIVPAVFAAAIVGVGRLMGRVPPSRRASALWLCAAGIALGTAFAQLQLRTLPLRAPGPPDARLAASIALAGSIPASASVAVEDHRLLAHAAHRRRLYYLAPWSPAVDYVLFDQKGEPITNVPPAERRELQARLLADPAYQAVDCAGGTYLLGRRGLDHRWRTGAGPGSEGGTRFGPVVRLLDARVEPGSGSVLVELRWTADSRPEVDYQVFTHLVEGGGRLIAQHDGPPAEGDCRATLWGPGLVVVDRHPIALPAGLPPGSYEVRVGLYDLRTVQRLPVTAAGGGEVGPDYALVRLQL